MIDRRRRAEEGALIRLVDAGLTVADPAADVRGRRVVDRTGADVGRVDAPLQPATLDW